MLHRSKAKTTSGFNSDRKIRQYAHGLLLESPFLPSSTDCWAIRAKIRQKAAKPEVEVWRRPKKWTFWPWFPIHSFRHFFARTHRFATIQNVTDGQTDDRQTRHCTKGSTDSTVGQKSTTLTASLFAVLRQYRRVTDRQTDRQTDRRTDTRRQHILR